MDNTKEKQEQAKQAQVLANQQTQAQQKQQTANLDDMDNTTRRTVEDIRFDILCGVDVPPEEREMEIKDLYERMQDDSLKGVFGNTVSKEEFFKHMYNFRVRLNDKYIGESKTKEEIEARKVKALKDRVSVDTYITGKIDTNGDGIIQDDEIAANRERVDRYYGSIDMQNDITAFNAVKINDIEIRKFLVRKYMENNPRFIGATIERVVEENDEIRFYIHCSDGEDREFVPKFDKGKNGVLDYLDSVEKMVLNIQELNTILDKHDKGM
jgi:hypothetical protein